MKTTIDIRHKTQATQATALWLGDLHLDKTHDQKRRKLFGIIRSIESDCLVITGDVSNSSHLKDHLTGLASACWPRPLHFVPGNHDFHGSSIAMTGKLLMQLTGEIGNFHYLNGAQIIRLGPSTCLVGHGGWADARAGYGQSTIIDTPDRHSILEFRGLNREQALRKMRELGMDAAAAIRKILPLALAQYQHVVIAMHVPPFPTAVRFSNRPCGPTHLPHFSNLSAGLAIIGIARAFPHRRITILAGHSHSGCTQTIMPNLTIRVGHARTGKPGVFELVKL